VNTGVPTVGVTTTVRITCAEGPLQPLARTWIFTLPEKPFAHDMTPVELLIDPASALLIVHTNPALFVADEVYVVVVVPLVSWHAGSVPADTVMGVGVPTVGVILTV